MIVLVSSAVLFTIIMPMFIGLPTYRQVFQTGTDLSDFGNSICSSCELAEVENELVEIRDILNNYITSLYFLMRNDYIFPGEI